MNGYVKPGIARLLKEKDFNEPVTKCYNKDDMLASVYSPRLPENINGGTYEVSPNAYTTPPYFAAPTLSDVVMWLYRKHKIWVEANIAVNGNFKYTVLLIETAVHLETMSDPIYITPEKAYEAGIEHVLNNRIHGINQKN